MFDWLSDLYERLTDEHDWFCDLRSRFDRDFRENLEADFAENDAQTEELSRDYADRDFGAAR
jgi:hypothetical protein